MTYTPEQQAENRAKWVAALRSGEYKQAVGSLARQRRDGQRAHCCLGVACELAAAEGVVAPALRYSDDAEFFVYPPVERPDDGSVGASGVLPTVVQDWLGLDSDNGHISNEDCLSQRNDRGQTFEQIADVIEQGDVKLADVSAS